MAGDARDGGERYELLERIAVGGMAEVFRARRHGSHGFAKELAIKRILPELASDPQFVARFVAEAKIAVTLSHPNIVSVFDFSRFGESLYIAMELVDGLDLAALIKRWRGRGAAVPVAAAVHIAAELLRGIEFAHGRGVVHRDISPANVLLSRAGEVKIADFGIARASGQALTRKRQVMGKWPYVSPEHSRGAAADSRSDIFSAGAVIHELFTGRRLFDGETAEAIVLAVRSAPVEPPSARRPGIPAALDAPVLAMLSRDPARRPDAAAALAALLEGSAAAGLHPKPGDAAAAVTEVAAERSGDTAGARLIDDIIDSELAHARGESGRVTRSTEPAPVDAPPLSFVAGIPGAAAAGELAEWLLGDETRTYTFKETAQLFALRERATLTRRSALAETVEAPTPEAPKATLIDASGAARRERRPSRGAEPAGPQPVIDLAPERPRRRRVVAAALAALALAAASVALWASRRRQAATPPGPPSSDTAPARLWAHTEPAGAEVRLDGVRIGTTPLDGLALAPRGSASLTLSRDGYRTETLAVELAAGARVRVRRRLEPTSDTGTIDLLADPPATIYYRGRRIGKTPARGLVLPAGRRELLLVNPDERLRKSVVVTVPANKPYRISLRQRDTAATPAATSRRDMKGRARDAGP